MTICLDEFRKPDKGVLFVVTGSSGTGKTTLVKHVLDTVPYIVFSVSVTTRAPRPGEIDGVDYRFISEDEYDRLLKNDAFLEHAEVYGHRYGTVKSEVLERLSTGTSVILDIDTQGAEQVRKKIPEAVSIFILPPSLEALEYRLRKRGLDPPEEIDRRIAEARMQINECGKFDYLVMNENLESAKDQLTSIMIAEMLKSSRRASWILKFTAQV